MSATLTAGDIAFLAAQSDNSGGGFGGDAFEFVLLRPVAAGTTIWFTDGGYRTDTARFSTDEQVLRWVAQANLASGTVIGFTAPGGFGPASTAEWTGLPADTGSLLSAGPFGLSISGDNITALIAPSFGGADALNGTAIAAITWGGASFASSWDASSGRVSTALPPGLTDGVHAVSIAPTDNIRLSTGHQTGTAADLRTFINNDANWTVSATPLSPHSHAATLFNIHDSYTGVATAENILGGGGNDTLDGAGGDDTMDGGAGIDTASFASATGAVLYGLLAQGSAFNTGGAGTESYTGFENLTGSAFNDTLGGDTGGNVLEGGQGDDLLYGWIGADTLLGGTGHDVLDGGSGNDSMVGGAGDDIYVVADAGDSVVEAEGEGFDIAFVSLHGWRAAAHLEIAYLVGSATGIDGSAANDTLVARPSGAGNLLGTGGDDTLWGQAGDDTLGGGEGNDVLRGGAGNDRLIAGRGDDQLVGGAGADLFQFDVQNWGYDQIFDFNRDEGDKIDFRGAIGPGIFINTLELEGHSILTSGGFRIDVYGVTGLSNSDFILV